MDEDVIGYKVTWLQHGSAKRSCGERGAYMRWTRSQLFG